MSHEHKYFAFGKEVPKAIDSFWLGEPVVSANNAYLDKQHNLIDVVIPPGALPQSPFPYGFLNLLDVAMVPKNIQEGAWVNAATITESRAGLTNEMWGSLQQGESINASVIVENYSGHRICLSAGQELFRICFTWITPQLIGRRLNAALKDKTITINSENGQPWDWMCHPKYHPDTVGKPDHIQGIRLRITNSQPLFPQNGPQKIFNPKACYQRNGHLQPTSLTPWLITTPPIHLPDHIHAFIYSPRLASAEGSSTKLFYSPDIPIAQETVVQLIEGGHNGPVTIPMVTPQGVFPGEKPYQWVSLNFFSDT